MQHGNRRLVGYNQCGAWRHLWPLIEAAFTHATTETPAGQPRAGVFFETLAAVGAGLRSRALSFGTQNDWLRRIALSRLSVATCAVIAEGPGRLGDLADFHQAGCTHHNLFGAAHGRLYDSSIGCSANDAKLWRRGDTVSAVLSRRTGQPLWPRRSGRSSWAGVTLVALVPFVALHAAAAEGQGGKQGADEDQGYSHRRSPVKAARQR